MTPFEMTKLCALAIGHPVYEDGLIADMLYSHETGDRYNPLENDGQAMELVKRFELALTYCRDGSAPSNWFVSPSHSQLASTTASNRDLNRAIVECVAKSNSPSTRT